MNKQEELKKYVEIPLDTDWVVVNAANARAAHAVFTNNKCNLKYNKQEELKEYVEIPLDIDWVAVNAANARAAHAVFTATNFLRNYELKYGNEYK